MITDNNIFLLTNYNLLFMNCIGYLRWGLKVKLKVKNLFIDSTIRTCFTIRDIITTIQSIIRFWNIEFHHECR